MVHVVEDLAEMAKCANGEGPHMLLTAQCHPSAGSLVYFVAEAGTISVRCAQCGMGIIDVAVAKKRSWSQRKKRARNADTPKTVQRMDQRSRANRRRRKG